MKQNLLLVAVAFGAMSLLSLKSDKKDPFLKYDKVYYADQTVKKTGFTVDIANAVDYDNELKFAYKVTNTSNDFLLIQKNSSKISKLDQDFDVEEKTQIVAPQKTKSQTLKCIGGGVNRAKAFNFSANSVFKLKLDAKSQLIEDVKIPLAKKDFTFNNVSCDIDVKDKSTQSSKIVVTVANNSDNYLFIYQSRAALKMPDDNSYASTNTKDVDILEPNKSTKLTYKWDRMPGGKVNDMQMVTMYLQFKDVFYFATPEAMESFSVDLEWDEAVTEAKK